MLPNLSEFCLLTDFYEFSMANGFLNAKIHNQNAIFNYFFRRYPFSGSYAIIAGVENFLDIISEWKFSDEDIEYLKSYETFNDDFLDYLSSMNNELTVWGMNDGQITFANEPILQISGPLIQCQLIETLLLNSINYPTLCATKANGMWLASGKKRILEFGARRAQGPDCALTATYASIVGGCSGTSNVLAGKKWGIKASGTMAHSWIMSFPTEYDAFKKYVDIYPDSAILLVDTYDTLKLGVSNAIKIGKYLEKKGNSLKAIRLDSGDMVLLSIESRKMLDKAGFKDVKIIISNDVDEYYIRDFENNGGKADIWGIGTKLVTCFDDPALGGVYKLVEIDKEPKIKLSGDQAKITIPYEKSLIRFYKKSANNSEKMVLDVITLSGEGNEQESSNKLDGFQDSIFYDVYDKNKKYNIVDFKFDRFEDLLKPLFSNGKRSKNKVELLEARKNMEIGINKMDERYLRLENPETYRILISEKLYKPRQQLIKRKLYKEN